MRLSSLLVPATVFGIVSAVPRNSARTILEFNADALGDSPGRPAGHETTPYREGLKDPYTNFAEKANPHDVLGE